MKPNRPITALQRWMRDNRWSDPAFANAINEILARGNHKAISAKSVAKWRRGDGVPRPATQLAIKELTRGAVTPDDLVEAPVAPEAA